jgi:heat shock protein 1/8
MAAIGIDLGSANTRVAVFRNDKFEMIPHEGQSMMPSVVAFTNRGRLVGRAARFQANIDPRNAVFGALKLLGAIQYQGLNYDDTTVNYAFKYEGLPLKPKSSASGSDPFPRFDVQHKNLWVNFTCLEILAMILRRAKKDAESYLGRTVEHAVITIPTSFRYDQRLAIKDAATIAGIHTLLLVHTSTAALTDLAHTEKMSEERNVMVCDIGAERCGVTLATLEDGIIEVKAVDSFSDHNGGSYYDKRLLMYAIHMFKRRHPQLTTAEKILQDLRAMRRLKTACEGVKRQLSSATEAVIEIENFHAGKDLRLPVTRAKFQELIQDLVHSLIEPIQRVLLDAKMDKASVHQIVLIGGSSRIPMIRNKISAIFAWKPHVLPLNPDEASARGAAVLASIYSGDTTSKFANDLLLLDILPKSLGIETEGGVMTKISKRNATIPTKRSESFDINDGYTPSDGRSRLQIPAAPHRAALVTVFEGERARTKDNLELGEVPIPFPLARSDGDVTFYGGVEVTFDIDQHCLLNVTLKDMRTGQEQTVTLDGRSDNQFHRLTEAELKSLVIAEEMMQVDDDLEQRRIETQNALEELLYRIRALTRSTHQARKIEDVHRLSTIVDGTLSWMESDPLATLSEYESRIEQLRQLEKEVTGQQADQTNQQDEDELCRTNSRATDRSAKSQEERGPSPPIQDHLISSNPDQKQKSSFHAKVADDLDRAESERQDSATKTARDRGGPAADLAVQSDDHENLPHIKEMQMRKTLASLKAEHIERSSTPRTSERGLGAMFDKSAESDHAYTDAEFNQVSTYLKNTGQPDWSQVPRLYTVLRLIDGLDVLEVFIEQGITDIWFPFEQTTLPRVLSPTIKANLLKHQHLVLSKSLLFEKNPKRRHTGFLKDEPLPYEVVGKLGAGAHGQVDKVISIVSHRVYARKLFQRVRGMRKEAIKSFLTELQVLKRVQHYHCVELVREPLTCQFSKAD